LSKLVDRVFSSFPDLYFRHRPANLASFIRLAVVLYSKGSAFERIYRPAGVPPSTISCFSTPWANFLSHSSERPDTLGWPSASELCSTSPRWCSATGLGGILRSLEDIARGDAGRPGIPPRMEAGH
jgi:hypothetical protein